MIISNGASSSLLSFGGCWKIKLFSVLLLFPSLQARVDLYLLEDFIKPSFVYAEAEHRLYNNLITPKFVASVLYL